MTKSATKSERERWSWFQDIGCIACLIDGHPGVPADVAHETNGGRREGHEFTFPLCPFHHRGVLPDGMDGNTARAIYGPSFAYSKRDFEARYGTERRLVEITNDIIAARIRGVRAITPSRRSGT
jgi:hypothetical protein